MNIQNIHFLCIGRYFLDSYNCKAFHFIKDIISKAFLKLFHKFFHKLELCIKSNQGKRAVAAIYRLKQSKKRLSFKTRESLKAEEADLMSKLISGPSNFSHVQHMGPGDGLQILQERPLVSIHIREFYKKFLKRHQSKNWEIHTVCNTCVFLFIQFCVNTSGGKRPITTVPNISFFTEVRLTHYTHYCAHHCYYCYLRWMIGWQILIDQCSDNQWAHSDNRLGRDLLVRIKLRLVHWSVRGRGLILSSYLFIYFFVRCDLLLIFSLYPTSYW